MSVATEIQNGKAGYLDLEGHITAEECTPVWEVVRLMRRFDRTTALITRENRLSGIFTERDVLQKVVSNPETLERPVRELMTPDPTVVAPELNILGALRLMNEGHFRDLPVVDARGKIMGNLTDNAIVRYLCDHLRVEVLNLPPDPNQVPKAVDGA